MSDNQKNIVQINSQLFLQYSEIVKKIAHIRIESKTNQDAAADMIGVSRRTIIDFEKCECYNWSVFVALCDRFGITLDLYHELE